MGTQSAYTKHCLSYMLGIVVKTWVEVGSMAILYAKKRSIVSLNLGNHKSINWLMTVIKRTVSKNTWRVFYFIKNDFFDTNYNRQ